MSILLFVLSFVLPFLLVFSVIPETLRWKRTGRLIIAIACAYICFNLTLHVPRYAGYVRYEACLESLAHLFKQPDRHAACSHHVNIADGASNVFWLYLGWLPAIMIVGWWELLWRKYHRAKMVSLRKGMGDDWIANLIVTLSYYMTLLLAVAATLFVLGILFA